MGARSILLATLFIALTGVSAILLRAYLTDDAAETAAIVEEEEKSDKPQVLTMNRDLDVGAFLTIEDLEWEPWQGPGEIVLSQHFLEGASDLPDVVGAVVRRPLKEGEPLVAGRIVRPGERGFLAAVLRPGMRAVSVSIDAVSGNSGLIFPGDRVDVILTVELDDRDATMGSRLASQTVLRDLRVIAIGQRVETLTTLDAPDDGGMAKTATLEVRPEDAERLTVASHIGRLALSLRSLSVAGVDDGMPFEAGETSAALDATWAGDVASVLRGRPKAATDEGAGNPAPATGKTPTLTLMRGGMEPQSVTLN